MEKISTENRIVILTFQRCGSSFLVSALNSHYDFNFAGELFCREEQTYFANSNIIQENVLKSFRDYKIRSKKPLIFLKQVKQNLLNQKRYFGFKLMNNQGNRVHRKVLQAGDLLIVLLRSNLLASYSSELLAKKSGVGHKIDSSNPEKIRNSSLFRKLRFFFHLEKNKVTIDEHEFFQFVESRKKKEKQLFDLLNKTGKDFFLLDYSKDLSGTKKATKIHDLQKWLGVEPIELISQEIKRHGSNILFRFNNPLKVIRCLVKIKKINWIFE